MAKIKGIELKSVVEFKGHEGEPLLQGKVYYKGKDVGFYSDDSWGGLPTLDYTTDDEALKKEVQNIIDNYDGNVLFKELNSDELSPESLKGEVSFFCDLIRLRDHENYYKKFSKKWNLSKIFIVYPKPWELTICGKEVPDKYKDFPCYEYNSLNDFNVG